MEDALTLQIYKKVLNITPVTYLQRIYMTNNFTTCLRKQREKEGCIYGGEKKKRIDLGKKKYNPPCCENKIGGIRLFFPTSLKAELKRGRKKKSFNFEASNVETANSFTP